MRCWLAQFSDRPCDGPFEPIHLIDKKALKAHGVDPWIAGSFVHGCRYHHANFDNWRLTVPRESLPERFVRLCDELGLSWWVERRYPPKPWQDEFVSNHEADLQAAREGLAPR